jgi:hypothetical protein
MNPGLHVTLNVHRGCRRVDPPAGHQKQHGKGPQKQRNYE